LSKTGNWHLVAPDWAALDTVWKNPLPFVLWPVCGKPLLAYWLDEALRREAETITICATDRPHLIRRWLDLGDYWSKKIPVVTGEPPPGGEVHRMDALPGAFPPANVGEGQRLLEHWFSLHRGALAARKGSALLIDREISPGIWAAPGAVIDPSTKLAPPCWIGPRTRIGRGCKLGPDVFVGSRAVIDDDVEVSEAVVCEDTYIGRHTRLEQSVAQGGLLINWKLGVALNIVDDFILAGIGPDHIRPGMGERILAMLLWLPCVLAGMALNAGKASSEKVVLLARGRMLRLATWPRGPVILRRARWIGAVAAGHLRIVGVLPRSESEWETLPPEVRALLESSPSGVLSLSDLHGCHDPAGPDEWMHAVYQAGAHGGAGRQQALRAALVIALKNPLL